jgi:hypothetical protein
MTWLKLFLALKSVLVVGTVWFLFYLLVLVLMDHVAILYYHYSQKRTWVQTRAVFGHLYTIRYWWKIRDFYPTIRAKVILRWHLSSLGKKIDLHLIKKRKDEFHRSLMMDTKILMYLNKEETELYYKNLNRRRSIAHELDLHEPLITPIN